MKAKPKFVIRYPNPNNQEEAVVNGVAWLDTYVPNWWNLIDVKELNLANDCKCVLGQLGGGTSFRMDGGIYRSPYELACKEYRYTFLRDTALKDAPAIPNPYTLGFDYAFGVDDTDYELLTRLWTEVITDRREAGAGE